MTADYMQSREVRRRRRGVWRYMRPLLFTIPIVAALLVVLAWLPLRQGRDAWIRGENARAISIGERWLRFGLWPSHYHQLLAAAYLASGSDAAAAPHLGGIGSLRFPIIPKDELARRLFARERYDAFLSYDAASVESGESADVPLYRTAAMVATNRIAEAQKAFASIDKARVDGKRYAALERTIAARVSGTVPYVYDRNGGTVAVLRSHVATAIDDDFRPLISREAGQLTIGARQEQLGENATIETTLDPFVQKAAIKALTGFRGSLVAIDPRTNEILAIASNRGNGPLANLAIEHQYEPGSVVKVLTGLNAEDGGLDLPSMFPYECKGSLDIDGRHFSDWVTAGHGTLRSIDDALAVSCNIFFADIGMRLGADRLKRFMTAAGFGSTADLGVLQVPLGKTIGPVNDRFESAFFAIGLEHESMNALHIAMLASMMANRGVLTSPRLLVQRRSILGDVIAGGPRPPPSRLASTAAAEALIRSMQAVVTDPKGTGRRALVPGISLAMKTGTAGERKSGLEAVILAFAPVESPRIAFGMIAEDAGPAEFAGAKIAHDFLEAMQSRLK